MTPVAIQIANHSRFVIPPRVSTQHARELRAHVRHALRQGQRSLTVDCSAWEQVDVSMLSSLIQCASACHQQGASFQVANVSHQIEADVRALRLDDRLGL